MGKIILLVILLFGMMIVNAQEFWLKINSDNSLEGPFDFKEGGDVILSRSVSTIRDAGRFGKDSFLLELKKNGKKYGPFQLKNNASIVLENIQYSVIIFDNPEQPAKLRGPDSKEIKMKMASNNLGQSTKTEAPDSKENKDTGIVGSDTFVKFKTALDIIDNNFRKGISADNNGDWLAEYKTKFIEFKDLSRKLQTKIIEQGCGGAFNIPNSVNIMYESFLDARKKQKTAAAYERRSNSSTGNNSTVRRGNSSEDELTSTGVATSNQRNALRSTCADFDLAVAHLRKDLMAIEKTNK